MENQIEIYVRQSAGRTLFNLYVPEQMQKKFIEALRMGSFEAESTPTHLELSVLPEWVTDQDQRKELSSLGEPLHLRVPITCINTQFSGG